MREGKTGNATPGPQPNHTAMVAWRGVCNGTSGGHCPHLASEWPRVEDLLLTRIRCHVPAGRGLGREPQLFSSEMEDLQTQGAQMAGHTWETKKGGLICTPDLQPATVRAQEPLTPSGHTGNSKH